MKNAVVACFELRSSWKGGQWQTWNAIEETTSALLRECTEDTICYLSDQILLQPIVGIDEKPVSPLNKNDIISAASLRAIYKAPKVPKVHRERIETLFSKLETEKNISNRARIIMRINLAARWQNLNTEEKRNFYEKIDSIIVEYDRISVNEKQDYFLTERDMLVLAEEKGGLLRKALTSGIAARDWSPLVSRREDGTANVISLAASNDPIRLAAELTTEPWAGKSWLLSAEDWEQDQVCSILKKSEDWLQSEGVYLLKRERSEGTLILFPDSRSVMTVAFCRKVVLGKSRNREILQTACRILQVLEENGVQTTSCVGLLISAGYYTISEAANVMRRAASSLQPTSSGAFMIGLLAWLSQAKAGVLSYPPEDLVHEIAVAVRGRRAPDLMWALATATIILQEFGNVADERFRRDISVGLQYLATESDLMTPSLNFRQQQGSWRVYENHASIW